MKLLEKAKIFAKTAHAGQKRWKGEDYYEAHCLVVLEYVQTHQSELFPASCYGSWTYSEQIMENVHCAAVLHDTIEDCDVTYQDIYNEFNIMVAGLVDKLTRQPNKTYLQYISNIVNASEPYFVAARAIKIADLRCNMSDLKPGSMKDKYELAEYILLSKLT